jgi:hypothetical protein
MEGNEHNISMQASAAPNGGTVFFNPIIQGST